MESNHYGEMSSLESSLFAARAAKVLCSAVFVSGRDPDEALRNSVLAGTSVLTVPEEVFSEIDIARARDVLEQLGHQYQRLLLQGRAFNGVQLEQLS